MRYTRGKHRTQYDGSAYASENCTPTSGANGARESSGGRYDHTGAYIRGLVKRSEEQNPNTPGWSLADLDLAMRRAGIAFTVRSGQGWTAVRNFRAKGLGIALQGDSDRFADSTCSGAFNGDHCVYVHPETKVENGITYWMLGDPICGGWRWEKESVLRAYAEKFSSTIRFGTFDTPVPLAPIAPAPTTGADMPAIVKYLPGYTANIKPASNVRSAPNIVSATFLRKTGTTKEAVVITGTVKGDVDPANGSTEWYVWHKNGRWEHTAKDNILDLKAPATSTAPAYPDLRAPLAAAQATVETQTATIAELRTEVAAVASLKDALRRFLGL